MIQWRISVRRNTPQIIGPYTFKDQDEVVIDLTPYVSVWLLIKHQGELVATLPAVVVSPATAGQAKVASYTFASVGTWSVQFYAQDGAGNKVFGEPLQLKVVANVDDLTLSQLLVY